MRIVQRRISFVLLGSIVIAFVCSDGAPNSWAGHGAERARLAAMVNVPFQGAQLPFICARLVSRRIRVEMLRGCTDSIKVNRRGYDVVGVLGKGSEAR